MEAIYNMRLTRRKLIAVSALVTLVTTSPGFAQTWQVADGLRLAGPPAGLATLDPALTRDLQAMVVVRQIFRGLLRFGTDLEPIADLAEVIVIGEDLKSFSFQIREGVTFADGRPITSEDVKASFTRALSPSIAGGSAGALAAATYLGDIDGAADLLAGQSTDLRGLSVEDDRLLTITLVAPSATFLTRLASVPTSIVDVSQAAADPERWWTAPNATGPFSIAEFTDELLILQRNPGYGSVVGGLDRVSFLLGTLASRPMNLFQAGTIDVVANATGQSFEQLEDPSSSIDANFERTPLFSTSYIALGNTVPPLDDVHIRKALRFLISQDLIADSMFAGMVDAATGLVPNGMLGRNWSSPQLGVDFDQARAEIAASRYGSAANVPAISIYASGIEPVEALRDLAATELGLTIEAVRVPGSDFLIGLIERRYQAYSLYWGADYPDPEAMLGMLFRSDGTDNYTGYVNPEFDAILTTARSVADIDSRAALYQEAQDLLIEDAAVIPLYFDIGVTVTRPGISGLEVTPLGILGLESVTSAS